MSPRGAGFAMAAGMVLIICAVSHRFSLIHAV